MKSLFLTALALAVALCGNAQVVDVVSIERVAKSDTVVSEIATISPDGTFAVVGRLGDTRLTKVDLATGVSAIVADNATPIDLTISSDGNRIVFRTNRIDNNKLRHVGLDAIDLTTGRRSTVLNPSRRLAADLARTASMPVAAIDYGHLNITIDGQTTTIDPQGRGSYLWPSISPDGTKVVYCLSGAGTFVCNIDGSDVRPIGYLHAAKWLGNDKVVGMTDRDNGERLTSSEIVVCDLDGNSQVLTSSDMIAVFPSASADASKIVFSTADGALYIINLK